MNLSDYDNALKTKLQNVFPNIVNSSVEKALEYSENSQAEVRLPLISFWRLNNNFHPDEYVAPLVIPNKRGRLIKSVDEETTLMYKELPVNITYQIDVWSDRRYEADIIFQELLFFLNEEPYLLVKEDNVNEPYKFSVQIVETDTDIELSSFSENGDIFRQVITIKVNNAKLISPKASKIAIYFPIRVKLWDGDSYVDS